MTADEVLAARRYPLRFIDLSDVQKLCYRRRGAARGDGEQSGDDGASRGDSALGSRRGARWSIDRLAALS